jgi:hypothetical protein
MFPPTQEMIDSACQWGHESVSGTVKSLIRGGHTANVVQYDRESLYLDTSAPLSEWGRSNQAFDTAAECNAEREKPVTESEKLLWRSAAHLQFDDDQRQDPRALPPNFVEWSVATQEEAFSSSFEAE